MGLSRNKVAVPEGAAGTPPFWSGPLLARLPSFPVPFHIRYRRALRGFRAAAFFQSYSSVGQSATLIMWRSAVQLCLGLPFCGGLAQLARAPALQAGGQRFESVILHFPQGFFLRVRYLTCCDRQERNGHSRSEGIPRAGRSGGAKANKGARRMPRLPEATKGAASCENLRGGASGLRSAGTRMGEPSARKARNSRDAGRLTRGTETS